MQRLAGRPITIKPAFIWPSRAKFQVVAVTMDAPAGGCGAVIFIVWSRDNPVKYTDPDGRDFYNFTPKDIVAVLENEKEDVGYVNVPSGEMYKGKIDGVVLADDTVVKITGKEWAPTVHLAVETFGDEDIAYLAGDGSVVVNDGGDLLKKITGDLPSGVYAPETARNNSLDRWIRNARYPEKVDRNNPDVKKMTVGDRLYFAIFRAGTKVPLKKRD